VSSRVSSAKSKKEEGRCLSICRCYRQEQILNIIAAAKTAHKDVLLPREDIKIGEALTRKWWAVRYILFESALSPHK
jgi:hypothetical protein